MQIAASALQLVGVLITGGGMLAAWLAARSGLTVRQWFHQIVEAKPFEAKAEMFPPTVSVTYDHDPSLPIDQQLDQLAVTVESLRKSGSAQLDAIRKLRSELAETSSQLAAHMDKLDTESQEHLRKFLADQNKNRVIDLRWAATGLLITALGLGLALFDLLRQL